MSLETYDELKVSLKNWLDRDDLDPFLGDFIRLAESRFNRILRLRAMERKEKTDTVGGQSNYKLPNDFLQGREFRLNQNPTVSMQYITPEIYESWNLGQGLPKFYTIVADELKLGPVPSDEIEMEMLFYGKVPSLGSTRPTNWILLNAPDIYLYGSLLEAEAFLQNDPRIQLWKQGFDTAIADLQLQDDKDRHSASSLVIRS